MSWLKISGRSLLSGLVILITGGLALVVVCLGQLPGSDQHTAILFWSFVVSALTLVITLVGTAAKLLTPAPAPPADEQLRLLAEESRKQWAAAAVERRLLHPAPLPIRWRLSTAPVAGPTSAATYARFDPLPGLTPIPNSRLRDGDQDALHRVYGGLPSGRLLLIGPPGSGKSTAAILLLLDALRYREHATREDRAKIPVPVLFTLHGWQPDSSVSVTDWTVGKLAETYPMFRSRSGRHQAAALLAAGRLAVFLDGLDEIPESLRQGVLRALANAPFRLVLLTRSDEAKQAASHGPLAGVVALELQPVKPTDAAAYLLQPLVNPPPAPWQEISDALTSTHRRRQGSALAQALTTPLNLSLLRDTYRPTDPVNELLNTKEFPTAADIENHLLDHAITAAYIPRDGHPRPRYTVQTAQRTLGYLATQLTEHNTRDLAWWHTPTWTTRLSRIIRAALGSWLMSYFVGAVVLYLMLGFPGGYFRSPTVLSLLENDYVFRFVSTFYLFGIIPGLVVGFRWRSPNIPRRIRLTDRRILKRTRLPFAIGFAVGFADVVLVRVTRVSGSGGVVQVVVFGIAFGIAFGIVFGIVGGVIAGLARRTEIVGSVFGPVDVWRYDRNAGTVFGIVIGVVAGIVFGVDYGLAYEAPVGILFGVVTGVMAGVAVAVVSGPGSASMETALVCVQLKIQRKIPLRLLAFLEDARKKHLLRTVGPIYQFRHAKLQDRLAEKPQSPTLGSHRTLKRWLYSTKVQPRRGTALVGISRHRTSNQGDQF